MHLLPLRCFLPSLPLPARPKAVSALEEPDSARRYRSEVGVRPWGSGARCQGPGVRGQVSGARCQGPGVRDHVSGAICQGSGARCQGPGSAAIAIRIVSFLSHSSHI